jgi:hypothetical protein
MTIDPEETLSRAYVEYAEASQKVADANIELEKKQLALNLARRNLAKKKICILTEKVLSRTFEFEFMLAVAVVFFLVLFSYSVHIVDPSVLFEGCIERCNTRSRTLFADDKKKANLFALECKLTSCGEGYTKDQKLMVAEWRSEMREVIESLYKNEK